MVLAVAALAAAAAPARADESPGTLVDRVVVRWYAPELGGVAKPQFIFERELSFEARLEAFNALNWFRPATTGVNNPVVTVNSPTFGQILEAADPRIMQFAVKFSF